jgi:hypothetical protein
MSQEKTQVKVASGIEGVHRRIQIGSFFCIGSSQLSWGEIKQEFRGSSRLSHLPLLSVNDRFSVCNAQE